jgi:hypothetical protein
MIVNDFHVVSISVLPIKADPPLIVDPNAVLAVPVAVKLLQSVSREGQIAQAGGRIQLLQSSEGLFGNASKCL